jgi:predicted O-methyltransferase YrrM
MITDYIINKTSLPLLSEPTNSNYHMFNTGGVECEVGEFLYSFVRMIKPTNILETGTHFGISSTYMALALKANQKGSITTLDPQYYPEARSIHVIMELGGHLKQVEIHAENYKTDETYDIVFLDTEPKLRFSEFDQFFRNVRPGGFIFIHDLHANLAYGNYNPDHPTFLHWPYGDFREKMGDYIKNHDFQTISFPTPRGLSMFQKRSSEMSYIKHIKSEL